MKPTLIFAILFVLFSKSVKCQFIFEKHYPSISISYTREVFQLPDSGFLLQTTENTPFNKLRLIRTNSSGDTVWTKVYGNDSSIQYKVYDMLQTTDGGFLMCGDYQSFANPFSMDSYIHKIDSNGNTIWMNVYGLNFINTVTKDHAEILKQLSNGNFLVEGSARGVFIDTALVYQSSSQPYLAQFNSSGQLQKIKTIVAAMDTATMFTHTLFESATEILNDKIYWLGLDNASPGTNKLIVLNNNFDTLIIKTVANSYHSLLKTMGNKILIYSDSSISILDSNANQLNTFSLPQKAIQSIVQISSNDFVALSNDNNVKIKEADITYFNASVKFHLTRFDSIGFIKWNKTFYKSPTSIHNVAFDLKQCYDGGIVIVGSDNNQAWLVKTDSLANNPLAIPMLPLNDKNIHVFPNPATDKIEVNFSALVIENSRIEVIDFYGRKVFSKQIQNNSISQIINVSSFNSGLFMICVITGNQLIYSKKISILH